MSYEVRERRITDLAALKDIDFKLRIISDYSEPGEQILEIEREGEYPAFSFDELTALIVFFDIAPCRKEIIAVAVDECHACLILRVWLKENVPVVV